MKKNDTNTQDSSINLEFLKQEPKEVTQTKQLLRDLGNIEQLTGEESMELPMKSEYEFGMNWPFHNRAVYLKETGELLGVILASEKPRNGRWWTKGGIGFIHVCLDIHDVVDATKEDMDKVFAEGFYEDTYQKPGVFVIKFSKHDGELYQCDDKEIDGRYADYLAKHFNSTLDEVASLDNPIESFGSQ